MTLFSDCVYMKFLAAVIIFSVLVSMGRSVSFAVPLLGAALAFVLVELFNLAGLVKDLMSQVAALKDVVHHLESKKASQQPDSVPTEVQKKVETPLVEPAPIESTPIPEPVRSLNDEAEERGPKLTVAPVFALFERFFTTGNVFAKVGAIVLFFGVAFLIKLVSDAGLFPIEFRLMSTALGANILIAVGWRLRKKNRPYSLILQGTGFGVFFLTVFGAFRLWHLLPATPALFLLVSATILFVLLSIFQDALSLASLAVTGGFLAPLLTSTGSGSHVQLFTYYALLNTGIFVIAKYRPWRELNLIGFLFTFVVGGVWGSKFYVPEFFASVEPFIIFHFILYTAVVLLFSKLTFELSKELLVDGVLVFGVPLFTFFYQAALLKDTRFGIALSCALLGAVYVGLAFFLFRNKIQEKKSLVQAFVGSGITFSTLTVPYALTHIWTGSVWAIEGAALVWFGLRQEKSKIRYVGYCLHALAFVSFFIKPIDFAVLNPLANPSLMGSLVISLSAFAVAYLLVKNLKKVGGEAQTLMMVFLGVTFFWWFLGLLREVNVWYPQGSVQLLMGLSLWIMALSVFLFMVLAKLLLWPALALIRYPFMVLASIYWMRGMVVDGAHDHSCFLNSFYLGTLLVVSASSLISLFLFQSKSALWEFEKKASWVFLVGGYFLLLSSTHREWIGFYLKRSAEDPQALGAAYNWFVVIVSGIILLYFGISKWKKCLELSAISYGLPFLGAGTLLRQLTEQQHPFQKYGIFSWGALFGVQYLMVFLNERKNKEFSKYFHFGGLWLLSSVALWYVFELTGLKVNQVSVWNWAVMLGATGAIILGVIYYPKGLFPFGTHKEVYISFGLVPLVILLVAVAQVLNLFNPGNSDPLPYLPLLNPLGILVAFTLVVAALWLKKTKAFYPQFVELTHFSSACFGLFIFLWITMGVVRAVHHYGEVPWILQSLMSSHRVQTALSVCWGTLSLVTMILSSRKGIRLLWVLGSSLMVVVVAKLFFIDLKESGTLERVISFIATGVLLLATGYFAPLPPKKESHHD